MEKTTKHIFIVMLIMSLSVFLSANAQAGSEVSILGVVNEDGQLVDDGGMAYDIADNEEGSELVEMTGQKVTVKGTVMEAEGTKIVTVLSFKVMEE